MLRYYSIQTKFVFISTKCIDNNKRANVFTVLLIFHIIFYSKTLIGTLLSLDWTQRFLTETRIVSSNVSFSLFQWQTLMPGAWEAWKASGSRGGLSGKQYVALHEQSNRRSEEYFFKAWYNTVCLQCIVKL